MQTLTATNASPPRTTPLFVFLLLLFLCEHFFILDDARAPRRSPPTPLTSFVNSYLWTLFFPSSSLLLFFLLVELWVCWLFKGRKKRNPPPPPGERVWTRGSTSCIYDGAKRGRGFRVPALLSALTLQERRILVTGCLFVSFDFPHLPLAGGTPQWPLSDPPPPPLLNPYLTASNRSKQESRSPFKSHLKEAIFILFLISQCNPCRVEEAPMEQQPPKCHTRRSFYAFSRII